MKVFHVLLDSSVLFEAHFNHPDFKKLLLRSQERKIKVYIPHIVLEEHRTQITEAICQNVRAARKAFRTATRSEWKYQFIIDKLPKPEIFLWEEEEVDRQSRQVIDDFVKSNKIEVLPVAAEHASRAWSRYFSIAPPFSSDMVREDRRRDIPDSWILEAALDMKAVGLQDLCALCGDGRLGKALEAAGFKVFGKVEDLASMVDTALAVHSAGGAHTVPGQSLSEYLGASEFSDARLSLLGFIHSFDAPPREKLFDLLERAGYARNIIENVAQSMVFAGILTDSGSFLLPTDPALAAEAGAQVQPKIIKLLEDGK